MIAPPLVFLRFLSAGAHLIHRVQTLEPMEFSTLFFAVIFTGVFLLPAILSIFHVFLDLQRGCHSQSSVKKHLHKLSVRLLRILYLSTMIPLEIVPVYNPYPGTQQSKIKSFCCKVSLIKSYRQALELINILAIFYPRQSITHKTQLDLTESRPS